MNTGPARGWLCSALALAAASAVSLGMARFAYALLLPAMRVDLGWSYFTAGAMNTVNAAGYLAGALLLPHLLRRLDARGVMLAGGAVATIALALHGLLRSDLALYILRFVAGSASAASFVAGGVLAARLAGRAPGQAGIVLGIYYGGTGAGIVAAAWLVPPLLGTAGGGWAGAWLALATAAALCTAGTALHTRELHAPPQPGAPRARLQLRLYAWALAAYTLFGLGYIGYMTFIVTLLREQGLAGGAITAFYTVLGVGVMASSWLWARLLQRHRGGLPLALLNGLLALATLLPVLSASAPAAFVSGALFGAVFLSVVASTTALVRHNAPPAAWPMGIAAFTIAFAAGQIVGPSLVGLIADGAGGLQRGLAVSAAVLALAAGLAVWQRPVAR